MLRCCCCCGGGGGACSCCSCCCFSCSCSCSSSCSRSCFLFCCCCCRCCWFNSCQLACVAHVGSLWCCRRERRPVQNAGPADRERAEHGCDTLPLPKVCVPLPSLAKTPPVHCGPQAGGPATVGEHLSCPPPFRVRSRSISVPECGGHGLCPRQSTGAAWSASSSHRTGSLRENPPLPCAPAAALPETDAFACGAAVYWSCATREMTCR